MRENYVVKTWIQRERQLPNDALIFSIQPYQSFLEVERHLQLVEELNQTMGEKVASCELYLVTPSSWFIPYKEDNITNNIADCIGKERDGTEYNHFVAMVNATTRIVDRPRLFKLLQSMKIKGIELLLRDGESLE